jgi:hypothetical protein
VRFAEGTLSGTGTVDAVTSDYAIVWVWADEGQGRRMLMQGYGSIVSLDPEGTNTDDDGT